MAQSLFQVGLGIADDNVFYLSGSGAPLGTSGDITFDAPVGSYYSDTVTGKTYKKIANAGTAGDWEAFSTAGDTASLQAEVDRVETAAGLAADGTFVPYTGTNYINSAVSLKDADVKLDAAAKSVSDAVVAEAGRATAAEAALNSAISQEITDRSNAIAAVNAAIASEQSAREAADAVLTTAVAQEVTDRTAAVSAEAAARATAVTAEETARIAADAVLQGNITAEAATRAAADAAINTRIDNLDTGNGAALAALQAELDATQVGSGLGTNGSYTAPALGNYISTATSLADATVKLDAALKANADADATDTAARIAADSAETAARQAADTALGNAVTQEIADRTAAVSTEATARANADAALQTEIDAVEASVGLNANGTFAGFVGSNYMSAATTVKDGVMALDAQVKINTDGIATLNAQFASVDAALQAELDRLEAATGVAVDGSFVNFSGTNYINAASSNRNASVLLDGAIKSTTDALAAETARATGAEGVLQSNINAEATARTTADAAIQAELDATQTGAGLGADGTYSPNALGNYISAATSLKDADNKLDTALKVVADQVTALGGGGSGSLGALEAALAQEVLDRAAGDTALNTAISAEVTRATGAEGVLTTNLAAEVARATAAEGVLTSNLATEVADRSAADTALSNAITAEAGTRATADTALSAEDAEIRAFVGKTAAGVETPTYSSTNVVANSDNLKVAIGKLDAAVKSLQEGTESVAVTNNVTSAAVVDAVSTKGVGLVKWLVYVQAGSAKQAVEILASHDGEVLVDATTSTNTTYAKLRMGAIPGLSFSTTVSGSGAGQQLNLVVASGVSANVRVTRDVVTLA